MSEQNRKDSYSSVSIEMKTEVREILRNTYSNQERITDLGSQACEDHFSSMLSVLTSPPSHTTLRINPLTGDQVHSVAEEVQNIITKEYTKKGWDPPALELHPLIADVLIIANRGPMTVKQQVDKEVIVDLFCGMAVLRGANVFVQGIMGAPPGLSIGDLVSVYADVDGKCLKGFTKPYDGGKLFVGNGVTQVSRSQLFCGSGNVLSGVGIEMTEPIYQSPCLSEVLQEKIFPQNLPSVVCSHVLDPRPGEIILDMCAAPGGKTTHIACLMRNKGRVVALDKSAHKVEKIISNCKKWGVTCVECRAFDATKALKLDAHISGGPPYPAGSFDRVLVDAPCSALGQRPSAKNKMSAKDLQSYPVYQRKLLAVGVALLRPRGTLVYSTCSIPLEENEKQVEWLLTTYPDLQLETQSPMIGGPGFSGASLSNEDRHKVQRFDPATKRTDEPAYNWDTIGFFIAKFTKKAPS